MGRRVQEMVALIKIYIFIYKGLLIDPKTCADTINKQSKIQTELTGTEVTERPRHLIGPL